MLTTNAISSDRQVRYEVLMSNCEMMRTRTYKTDWTTFVAYTKVKYDILATEAEYLATCPNYREELQTAFDRSYSTEKAILKWYIEVVIQNRNKCDHERLVDCLQSIQTAREQIYANLKRPIFAIEPTKPKSKRTKTYYPDTGRTHIRWTK